MIHCTRCFKVGASVQEYPELSFIPLEYVEECKLDFSTNARGYVDPVYSTQKKDPVKGAIVGGVLAGPTGAVVGAVANSGEKKVTVSSGGAYDEDYYSLVIKVKDSAPYVKSNYYMASNNANTKSEVDRKNSNARELIERAKSLQNEGEKKALVSKSLKEGKAAIIFENVGITIAGIAMFVGAIILMMHF